MTIRQVIGIVSFFLALTFVALCAKIMLAPFWPHPHTKHHNQLSEGL